VLRKAERRDEATNCLWRAVALAPNDAGAHADLAELLQAAGANDKAKAALLKAIRLKPDSPELCERAARVLHALGHAAEAAELYRRALDLREAQLSQARKARAHMSEIPIATLKTT
jgi:tetratricopeptide (TPR) repeat protein